MKSAALVPVVFATLMPLAAVDGATAPSFAFPWRAAGLSERQAAAHLLDRFAYGARPDDIDRVVAMGLETWFRAQLDGNLPDRDVDAKLARLRSLGLSNREILERYPPPPQVIAEARRAGVLPPESTAEPAQPADRRQRGQIEAWARGQGYRSQRELLGELMTKKIVRAVYSENQVREVLTDFWFNHFNVSLSDSQARPFVPTYERDAIRPHILGDFRVLLEATAKHPAMLLYLDNAQSTANEGAPTTFDRALVERRGGDSWLGFGAAGRGAGMSGIRGIGGFGGMGGMGGGWGRGGVGGFGGPPRGGASAIGRRRGAGDAEAERQRRARPSGLNENYARELLELHTLGVDAGYSQQDVIEVARALSGWTLYPMRARQEGIEQRVERALSANVGFLREGDFLFRADAHDAAAKTVLGAQLAAGRGLEDGEQVLDLVAAHPSTARHLARKFAARFVSDEPPVALQDRLAQVFTASGGDLQRLTIALVESPEFWAPVARRQKIKSPFELVASSLRALDADVTDPRELLEWLARMGQLPYGYQAPTGFPDRAEHWVNTGSLLNRMNFGLQLAAGRVAGVEFEIAALAAGAEPESPAAALATYAARLLPERDLAELVRQLEPVVRDPELAERVVAATPEEPDEMAAVSGGDELLQGDRRDRGGQEGMGEGMDDAEFAGEGGPLFRRRAPRVEDRRPPTPQQQVVGVILGSPEFQRR